MAIEIAMPLKPLFHLLSPSGANARLSVLIFHRVLPEPDRLFPDEVHARLFDRICGWLASWFNVLPLDAAAMRQAAGTLPAPRTPQPCQATAIFEMVTADDFSAGWPLITSTVGTVLAAALFDPTL